jgi:hypothetical protein
VAISVTPVTAKQATTTSGVTAASNSFTPAAGTMVVLCAGWMNFTNTTGMTFTCADSGSTSYTSLKAQQDGFGAGYALVFAHYYASSPGAVTVKVTASGTGSADCLLQPYTLAGASSSLTGATAGANGTTSTSTCQVSITPTQLGSFLFGAGALTFTPTAVSGWTTSSSWNDTAGSGDACATGVSTAGTSALSPVTVGWTLSPNSSFGFGIAAAEILPAATSLADLPFTGRQAVKRASYY